MQVHNVEQGTPEWHQLRLGIPTGSRLKDLFTASHKIGKGVTKSILSYAAELAADKQSGILLSDEEGFRGNKATDRGHELEPAARDQYTFETGLDVAQVGFVTNHGAGCSPDGLVGDDGCFEAKCLLAKGHTLAVAAAHTECPADYYVQCQAEAWICEREWTDLYLFHPHLPCLKYRVMADEAFQKLLETQVALVIAERDKLVAALEKAA